MGEVWKAVSDNGEEIVVSENIDDLLKLATLEKLKRETALIRAPGWSFDSFAKVAVSFFGVVGAIFAIVIGLPATTLEAAKTQLKLIEMEKIFSERKASMTKDLAESAVNLQERRAEIQSLQDELKKQVLLTPSTLQTAQLKEATKPRVFVQFAGGIKRKTIDGLRDAMAIEEFVTPGAERINRGQSNEVRYFLNDPAERGRAERVGALTEAYFKKAGCPLAALPVKQMSLPDNKSSPIEVWLNHKCDEQNNG